MSWVRGVQRLPLLQPPDADTLDSLFAGTVRHVNVIHVPFDTKHLHTVCFCGFSSNTKKEADLEAKEQRGKHFDFSQGTLARARSASRFPSPTLDCYARHLTVTGCFKTGKTETIIQRLSLMTCYYPNLLLPPPPFHLSLLFPPCPFNHPTLFL